MILLQRRLSRGAEGAIAPPIMFMEGLKHNQSCDVVLYLNFVVRNGVASYSYVIELLTAKCRYSLKLGH